MTPTRYEQSAAKTWLGILFCVFIILAQGAFAFLVVGDRGQPGWDYRIIKDIPGQSPFAVYELPPHPQHIRGAGGE